MKIRHIFSESDQIYLQKCNKNISLLLLHPFSLYFPWLSSKVIYASIDSHYCLVSHRKLFLLNPTHANNQNMVNMSHLGDVLQLENILLALKGNKNAYILLWKGHKHFWKWRFSFGQQAMEKAMSSNISSFGCLPFSRRAAELLLNWSWENDVLKAIGCHLIKGN